MTRTIAEYLNSFRRNGVDVPPPMRVNVFLEITIEVLEDQIQLGFPILVYAFHAKQPALEDQGCV